MKEYIKKGQVAIAKLTDSVDISYYPGIRTKIEDDSPKGWFEGTILGDEPKYHMVGESTALVDGGVVLCTDTGDRRREYEALWKLSKSSLTKFIELRP